jgi:hypothetical protein
MVHYAVLMSLVVGLTLIFPMSQLHAQPAAQDTFADGTQARGAVACVSRRAARRAVARGRRG